MNRITNIVLLSLVLYIFNPIKTLAMVNIEPKIIISPVIISNYEIDRGQEAFIYFNIRNNTNASLEITNITTSNNNILALSEIKNFSLKPNENYIVELKFKAIKHSVSYIRANIYYQIDGNRYLEFKDSQLVRIAEPQNAIEQFYSKYLKDILLPIMIAIISPLILNFVTWQNEKRDDIRINLNTIKGRLLYEIKKHKSSLGNDLNLNTEEYEKILLSDLYIFCLENIPKQLMQIEDYYKKVEVFNTLQEPKERYKKAEEIKSIYDNMRKSVEDLCLEKKRRYSIFALFHRDIQQNPTQKGVSS